MAESVVQIVLPFRPVCDRDRSLRPFPLSGFSAFESPTARPTLALLPIADPHLVSLCPASS